MKQSRVHTAILKETYERVQLLEGWPDFLHIGNAHLPKSSVDLGELIRGSLEKKTSLIGFERRFPWQFWDGLDLESQQF